MKTLRNQLITLSIIITMPFLGIAQESYDTLEVNKRKMSRSLFLTVIATTFYATVAAMPSDGTKSKQLALAVPIPFAINSVHKIVRYRRYKRKQTQVIDPMIIATNI